MVASAASPVVTRFAPSPTGFLHIGGARTALFNYLFAKANGGKFTLRIEDTDQQRSTPEATEAILSGMRWLGLKWDGEEVYQSQRAERHAEVAHQLLESGRAYKCYATAEELAEMRERARAEKRPIRYDGTWRDRDPADAPVDAPFTVRIKAPQSGSTTISDAVQGDVTVPNSELDDFIILRSDGTPTYMLAVVVDDHDMGVTHLIRGDDHLNNAFRQRVIIEAMDWDLPQWAHVPLIHGQDGAKLSKRHGALGVEAYREMGFLPEALENYLLRLGWGHGDEEIVSRSRAEELFTLDGIGRNPARFDIKKLENLNGHYIRAARDDHLLTVVQPEVEISLGRDLSGEEAALLLRTIPELKPRAKTINELADGALFLFRTRPLTMDEKASALLEKDGGELLAKAYKSLQDAPNWEAKALGEELRALAASEDVGLGKIAQPLRAALTGRTVSPGVFEMLELLGRSESLARIEDRLPA
ncbi:glutamate--tRNA ligase [Pacificimonas flava]|uniref:Glutamate--tRNA ligase n=2 Tax=Pacificimonas TaxID=1960290 RepID=A0A219B753_9SPHN|nr:MULTISPECIES: glutamate--tRNA ligase [Pacificimonas]MBZ6378624.1 glutamate--tRNA ligase [Pacificimonas aurantium]OWV34101.1 glutamate--tRNA ligase [Pacificimonas flava]